MAEEITNPAVASLIGNLETGLSPEMAGMIGAPPSMGGEPPLPPPQLPKEKPLTPKQAGQMLADAQSGRGMNMLAAKKFAQLAPMMPGAERVRVRKRRRDGSVATIKDYRIQDIEQSGDIEAFIDVYLRPDYGGGDYELALVDATGKEFNAGIARFFGASKDPDENKHVPPPIDPTAGMMPLMVEMYRNSTRPTPQPDPLTTIRQTKELLMDFGPKNNGSDNVILAMMQMQQAAQQENQKMMMALLAPRQDSQLVSMLERFDRRLEAIEKAPPPPPPPMMAPQGSSTAELLTAIGTLAASLLPLVKGDSVKPTDLAQLVLQAQTAAKDPNALSTRDVIAIFKDREASQSPPATMEEQFMGLIRAKELAQQISPPAAPGSGGATFWDAVIASFGGGELGKMVQAIGNRVDNPQQKPQQIVITENRQSQPMPAGHLQAPQEPPPPVIELPANFADMAKAISDAPTDGGRIMATTNVLLALAPMPQWRPFVEGLLELVARGERKQALEALASWFKTVVVAGGYMPRENAIAALKAFDQNFALVREEILQRIPQLRGFAQAPQAAPAAAPPPPASAAAPPPPPPPETADESASEEASAPDEPEVNGQTGPAPAHVDLVQVDPYTGQPVL